MSLPIGTRVRVKSLSHTLRDAVPSTGDPALRGTVVRLDELDYCIVRLDRRVRYVGTPGRTEWLREILEDAENLEAEG